MRILGIGGSGHDFSCALMENGKIICAVEEERLSREKHALGLRSILLGSYEYCLKNGKADMIITTDIVNDGIFQEKKSLWEYIKINHHLAHAASSYFTSGFSQAAVLVLDGGGSGSDELYESCSLGYA